ncbi:hypothetical protein [Streptomyces sp. NRRL S-241]|uniref:hypothetical protein n=1 Tax=Streptomyces sp. NRRL S-241 TaxID=1463896 RepID=UPI001F3E789B|nr:hypothetical protein [Streptomyces sp. NRRL S-241]
MTGAAVLATVAARTTHSSPRPAASKPPPGRDKATAGKAARERRVGRIPAQSQRAAGRPSAGSGRRSSASRASGGRGTGAKLAAGRAGSGLLARVPGGRKAVQAAALRTAAAHAAPSRSARRSGATAARRQVADARRAAKAATRTSGDGHRPASTHGGPGKPFAATSSTSTTRKPPAGGRLMCTAAKAAGKARAGAAGVLEKAVAAGRSLSDRQTAGQVKAAEKSIRAAARAKRVAALKRPAQQAARRALLRSATRLYARRAAAALLAGTVGLLGMVTSPLGRKLGWAWLIHPGRRLLAWLTARANTARQTRDAAIRAALEEAEQAAEQQVAAEQSEHETTVGDTVQRPDGPDTTPAPDPAPSITPTALGGVVTSTNTNTNGFRFEELAAEMEQAAQSYEPESAMEILAMIEGLPLALGSVANVMKILAERSDTEFPLDKAVAETFRDAFGAVMAAASLAEEMGPIFRLVHTTDIARHEDPRNGHEAEKGWNV